MQSGAPVLPFHPATLIVNRRPSNLLYDSDLLAFFLTAGGLLVRAPGILHARANRIPQEYEIEQAPAESLTAKQQDFFAPYDQKLAAMNYSSRLHLPHQELPAISAAPLREPGRSGVLHCHGSRGEIPLQKSGKVGSYFADNVSHRFQR